MSVGQCRSSPTLISTVLAVLSWTHFTCSQSLVNGQVFTNGLSIIDSPFPYSAFSSGSDLPISVEVSGNGQLPASALIPDSNLSTRYDGLEIYLLSSDTRVNFTVSAAQGFLVNETGSVRHLNWQIPSCIPPGPYNLTFYEDSHFDGQGYFIITPVPITVRSKNLDLIPCKASFNELQPQPQPSSALPHSPFLSASTHPGINTTTTGTKFSLPSSTTQTSAGAPVSSVTIVILSTLTSVETELGSLTTETATTTATVTMASSPENSGFFPVNFAPCNHCASSLIIVFTIGTLHFLLNV